MSFKNEAVTTFEVEGLTVHIVPDQDPQNPRENDNVCRMVCSHRRYDLGDDARTLGWTFRADDFEGWDAVKAHIEEEFKPIAIEPLSLVDHSGISISIGVSRGWDSGQVGFIYVTREQLEWGWGKEKVAAMTDVERVALAELCMKGEVEEYDCYLRGDLYGYVIERKKMCASCGHDEAEEVESVWGFYGEDDACTEGRSAAEAIANREQAKREQFEDAKEVL